MHKTQTIVLSLALLLRVGFPAAAGEPVPQPAVGQPPPPVSASALFAQPPAVTGIVFVANGAGDDSGTWEGFQDAVEEAGVPWEVENVTWSHHICWMGLGDLCDHPNHKLKGKKLAVAASNCRATHPDYVIVLVAHSAGAAVVLAAAECLEPNTVDYIVLLAPAVSAGYDLRPALLCSRHGIDVFYSRRDCLLPSILPLGTADRHWSLFAGQKGFKQVTESEEEHALYGKLRQHPWQPQDSATGHHGGHYGCIKKGYIHACVLPLLLPDTSHKP